MKRIPDNYHFVFGLKPQVEPFHIAWYLCLKSCMEINSPARVFMHYHYEPYGPWWDRIKPELEMVYVDEVDFIKKNKNYRAHQEGLFIKSKDLQYAHQADFIRLQALSEHGGVYADIDTLFVKPYPAEFFDAHCVMGRETTANEAETLCNAVILAEPESIFIETWLQRMYEVFDGSWNRHSCIEPALLSRQIPEQIKVVDREYFFHYLYNAQSLAALLGSVDEPADKVCSIHLWSHLWWDPSRNDFIRFHNGMLTEEFIRQVDTTYNMLARRFLDC